MSTDYSQISPELVEVGDLFETATDLRAETTGQKGNRTLGLAGSYKAKVVGKDLDTGAQVTVAWYEYEHERVSEAKKRANALLKFLLGKKRG